jgi:hypothetical protein
MLAGSREEKARSGLKSSSYAFGTPSACGGLNWYCGVYVMRTQTPLAPGQPDVTVHFVLNDFGGLGRAYVETDEAEADQATIVDNILSGQYSSPLRVIAVNTTEGWARDVTEDIAHAVLDRARSDHRPIADSAQEFLERVLRVSVFVNE